MSDGTETIVMPEDSMPKTIGDEIKQRIHECRKGLDNALHRFTVWDSLDQATKDKLDQITGYKPL